MKLWLYFGFLVTLSACGTPEPKPDDFTFIYDNPEHLITDTQTAEATNFSPSSLSQLAPAAGGMNPTAIAKYTSATQLRDEENRRAILQNNYESVGILHTLPSDY